MTPDALLELALLLLVGLAGMLFVLDVTDPLASMWILWATRGLGVLFIAAAVIAACIAAYGIAG